MSHTTTILRCTDCTSRVPGTYRLDAGQDYSCDVCGHQVNVPRDIAPNLEANEETILYGYSDGGIILRRLAVLATNACEACGSISDAHFDIRAGDDIPARFVPCPNDVNNDLRMARRAGLERY
jgi:DNA-directed RNA polymerase subunit RPC12/RpoP